MKKAYQINCLTSAPKQIKDETKQLINFVFNLNSSQITVVHFDEIEIQRKTFVDEDILLWYRHTNRKIQKSDLFSTECIGFLDLYMQLKKKNMIKCRACKRTVMNKKKMQQQQHKIKLMRPIEMENNELMWL